MRGIVKTFPGVKALDNVSLEVNAGEVHALLGENGAGKSTLIKVLGGIYKPDAGEIYIEDKKVNIEKVTDARDLGVSIIHQELMLVPEMTVAENIYMGREVASHGFTDARTMEKKAEEFIEAFGLSFHSSDKVKSLSIANQQMVEIIKAVSFGAKIIVMDEPTSSLTDKEVEKLFDCIRDLKRKNIGIIYISHRMSELYEITDKITVLRDGEYIDTVDTRSVDQKHLIALMVGRTMSSYYTKDSTPSDDVILEVEGMKDEKGRVDDVSFALKKGEILGFSGLIGAGRSELMELIFGLRKKKAGKVRIEGMEVSIRNARDAMSNGLALVPENRKEEGLYLVKDVSFNTTIEVLREFIKGIRVDGRKEDEITDKYTRKMRVKTPSFAQTVMNLSGGNQQKVLIARWLASKPKILILDEPTRGIDVGAKAEIYAIINELAKEGIGIIFISSELPEIINMSDRIVVMSGGRIGGVLEKDFTQEEIMYYATKELDKEESV